MSDVTNMPKPVAAWLYRDHVATEGLWYVNGSELKGEWDEAFGPYQIIPGMMSLDELAQHGLYISRRIDNFQWSVLTTDKDISLGHANALEAQWAATQLAKEAGHA